MIDGVIAGKVCGRPERMPDGRGGSVVAARLLAQYGEAGTISVSVVARVHEAQGVLLDLREGTLVVLQGRLTPKLCADEAGAVKPALDMVANAVLSTH